MTSGWMPRRPSVMDSWLRYSPLLRVEYCPSRLMSRLGVGFHWKAPITASRTSSVSLAWKVRALVAK
jgi:hypothetical protein